MALALGLRINAIHILLSSSIWQFIHMRTASHKPQHYITKPIPILLHAYNIPIKCLQHALQHCITKHDRILLTSTFYHQAYSNPSLMPTTYL